MPIRATLRLYLQDDDCFEADATVVAVRDGAIAFDRSCFYPGGGGQPPDAGEARLEDGVTIAIASASADGDGVIWHACEPAAQHDMVGQRASLCIDAARRRALSRYHTVLHVLNTIALRDHGGLITGAQIGVDYSRIDFKIEDFSAALASTLEAKANAVLAANHAISARYVPEEEFRERGDLLRTLEVAPPVVDGRVRVVAIEGFDAQACGGTHAHSTAELGALSIYRTENKGRINKRLYVRLDPPEGAMR
ncbi:MAG: alanyl-tRNA editing protein [Burkholderiales bacterium]|jgi:misacylated tRNA(Ala) deacylase|nr:alanyl-tRNA editing protein [Burkholderiales bacterium]